MKRLTTQRILATIFGALTIAFVLLDGWFNSDFNRVYFPNASFASEFAHPTIAVGIVAIVYFLVVLWTGRWKPWLQSN